MILFLLHAKLNRVYTETCSVNLPRNVALWFVCLFHVYLFWLTSPIWLKDGLHKTDRSNAMLKLLFLLLSAFNCTQNNSTANRLIIKIHCMIHFRCFDKQLRNNAHARDIHKNSVLCTIKTEPGDSDSLWLATGRACPWPYRQSQNYTATQRPSLFSQWKQELCWSEKVKR